MRPNILHRMLHTPRLYRVTLLLSFIGLALALTSLVFSKEYKVVFLPLYLYMPMLWLLWIGCLFFSHMQHRLWHLFWLWIVIDIAILGWFVSVAQELHSFAQSNGTEIIVVVTYFPIVVPFGLSIGFFADFNLVKYFTSSVGGAFAVWLEASIFAVIQSLIFIGLSEGIEAVKRRRQAV